MGYNSYLDDPGSEAMHLLGQLDELRAENERLHAPPAIKESDDPIVERWVDLNR